MNHVKSTLEEPLNSMLDEFKGLPSFSVVSSIKFNFPIDEETKNTKVQIELIVYGGSIKWWVEFTNYYPVPVDSSVLKFKDFLTRFNTYISVPFERLPLILPIARETPQYNIFTNLISHRFRLGV